MFKFLFVYCFIIIIFYQCYLILLLLPSFSTVFFLLKTASLSSAIILIMTIIIILIILKKIFIIIFFFNTVYILGFKLLPESHQDPRVVKFDAIHSLRAKTLLKMCAVPISAVFWIS